MDTTIVTDQYKDLMQRQKLTLQKAKAREGERPVNRKPRNVAYNQFMAHLLLQSYKPGLHAIRSSFLPPAYPPCVAALEDLKPIMIKDLRLETHHRGTYLLLRSLTPPNTMTAVMALMEDETGDVVILQMYHQEQQGVRKSTDVVDVGTVLLIKEPYYKVMGDGVYGVRVDHLSDVMHIKHAHPLVLPRWLGDMKLSADSLRQRGNRAVQEGRYWDAVAEYTHALLQPASADEVEVIKRNRSLALLKTHSYDKALDDSGFPDFTPKPHAKALFRAAEALYSLRRYTECCSVLQRLCKDFPQIPEGPKLYARAKQRVQEQETGLYQFEQLQAQAEALQPPLLDHATYLGPIEVRQTKDKGRGLFVTAAVKAGDLLLCEKAFAFVHADVNRSDGQSIISQISLLLNPETNRAVLGTQADLLTLIVQKMHHNPSTAPELTALHHGSYEGVPSGGAGTVVDTFLVDRIISLNVFGAPTSSLLYHKDFLDGKSTARPAYHSSGIWTYASYINHNCLSNARRAFIGDMMVVRATRDLQPGDEVSFWYLSPMVDTNKPHNFTHWGFSCVCAMCLDMKATKQGTFSRREQLVASLRQILPRSTSQGLETKRIERLLTALNETYQRSPVEVPRLLVHDANLALLRVYTARGIAVKGLASAQALLVSLGFIINGADTSPVKFAVVQWGLASDDLVEVFSNMRATFTVLRLESKASQAEEYARTVYRMIVGEDTSFDAVYGV